MNPSNRKQPCAGRSWHGLASQDAQAESLTSAGDSLGRDSIGDAAIAGDTRWAGAFGVNVDLVARSHCSVEMIMLEDMQARWRGGLGGRDAVLPAVSGAVRKLQPCAEI
jgi:hypothetical protein